MALMAIGDRDQQRIEVLSRVVASQNDDGEGCPCSHLSARQARDPSIVGLRIMGSRVRCCSL